MSPPSLEACEAWRDDLKLLDIREDINLIEGAYPNLNPYDVFRCFIAQKLQIMTGTDAQTILPCLAWTYSMDKGDLTLAVPRLRLQKKDSVQACKELADNFPQNRILKQPSPSGVSLRFDFLDDVVLGLVLPQVFKWGNEYGKNKLIGASNEPSGSATRPKRAVIEFSSPNIAKDFHIGHLRSTIIGAFLSNLYESMGWEVIRMNYLGDWGRQFGLLAAGWELYGSEQAFEQDPLRHLFQIYAKINADFAPEEAEYKRVKKAGQDTSYLERQGIRAKSKGYVERMENGDEVILGLWRRFRNVSIDKYAHSYARLNVVFDRYSGESEVKTETMTKAEQILQAQGVTEVNDGATIIDFAKHGRKALGVAVIRNRNNTTSYILRDVGAAIQRMHEYSMDLMIYVVMEEQSTHLAQLFAILELMGDEYADLSKRLRHITFGKVQGMSTRRGNVKLLEDVLDDISESMHNVMQRNQEKYAKLSNPNATADCLSITSLMVQDMSGKRNNGYKFDIERMFSFEGDTGSYLQYAHARLCSIIRRANFTHDELACADFHRLTEPHALSIARLIGSWPDTLLHTFKTQEPATVVTYLFRLAHQVSSSYNVLGVLNAEGGNATSLARAALFDAARQVLGNGIRILGLNPLEQM